MLRINRRKMIGLLLLSVSAIVYVFALASGQDSIFEYTLLLACLTFALLLNNDFELISPAVLFTAYFLYSIALGPIGLMNMGRFYSYGYNFGRFAGVCDWKWHLFNREKKTSS